MEESNFKQNFSKLADKNATTFMWQFGVGTIAYIALPTLLNKYVFKNNEMDGFLGLLMGLISAILLYLFTGWRGSLYAGYGHTLGQLIYYGSREINFEPFNAFPNTSTPVTPATTTTTNDYIPMNEYMTPPDYKYLPESINDGVNSQTFAYNEFYH